MGKIPEWLLLKWLLTLSRGSITILGTTLENLCHLITWNWCLKFGNIQGSSFLDNIKLYFPGGIIARYDASYNVIKVLNCTKYNAPKVLSDAERQIYQALFAVWLYFGP